MCDYSRKPVKWQVGNFSGLLTESQRNIILCPLFNYFVPLVSHETAIFVTVVLTHRFM